MAEKIPALVAAHAAHSIVLLTSRLADLHRHHHNAGDNNNNNNNGPRQHQRQALLINLLAYMHAWCAAAGFGVWYLGAVFAVNASDARDAAGEIGGGGW